MSLIITVTKSSSNLSSDNVPTTLRLYYKDELLELADDIGYNINKMILTEGKKTDDVLQYLITEGIIDEQ